MLNSIARLNIDQLNVYVIACASYKGLLTGLDSLLPLFVLCRSTLLSRSASWTVLQVKK